MVQSVKGAICSSLLSTSLLLPTTSFAVGLGPLKLHSALNQKLNADIKLLSLHDVPLAEIHVHLAKEKVLHELSAAQDYAASKFTFKVMTNKRGEPVIHITSEERLSEPYIQFLLDVSWPQGQLYRSYTMLLDPVEYDVPRSQNSERYASQMKPKNQFTAQTKQSEVKPRHESHHQKIVEKPKHHHKKKTDKQKPHHEKNLAHQKKPQTQHKPVDIQPMKPHAPAERVAVTASPPTEKMTQQTQTLDKPKPPLWQTKEYGPVTSRDRLFRIAKRYKPPHTTIDQMMLAIQRLNPHAFMHENINELKLGVHLKMPVLSDILSVSPAQALKHVALENSKWLHAHSPLRHSSQTMLHHFARSSTSKPNKVALNTALLKEKTLPAHPKSEKKHPVRRKGPIHGLTNGLEDMKTVFSSVGESLSVPAISVHLANGVQNKSSLETLPVVKGDGHTRLSNEKQLRTELANSEKAIKENQETIRRLTNKLKRLEEEHVKLKTQLGRPLADLSMDAGPDRLTQALTQPTPSVETTVASVSSQTFAQDPTEPTSWYWQLLIALGLVGISSAMSIFVYQQYLDRIEAELIETGEAEIFFDDPSMVRDQRPQAQVVSEIKVDADADCEHSSSTNKISHETEEVGTSEMDLNVANPQNVNDEENCSGEELSALDQAEVYLAYGHIQDAICVLENAYALNPKDYHCIIKLLDMYLKAQDRDKFITLYFANMDVLETLYPEEYERLALDCTNLLENYKADSESKTEELLVPDSPTFGLKGTPEMTTEGRGTTNADAPKSTEIVNATATETMDATDAAQNQIPLIELSDLTLEPHENSHKVAVTAQPDPIVEKIDTVISCIDSNDFESAKAILLTIVKKDNQAQIESD